MSDQEIKPEDIQAILKLSTIQLLENAANEVAQKKGFDGGTDPFAMVEFSATLSDGQTIEIEDSFTAAGITPPVDVIRTINTNAEAELALHNALEKVVKLCGQQLTGKLIVALRDVKNRTERNMWTLTVEPSDNKDNVTICTESRHEPRGKAWVNLSGRAELDPAQSKSI